ncbi:hypothetical protein ACQ4PT_071431 [Festuca glaucescens]
MEQRQKTCILNLDDDLITEFFARLPIRSVMRAGAVCKDFRRVAYVHRRPLEILLYSVNAAAAADRNARRPRAASSIATWRPFPSPSPADVQRGGVSRISRRAYRGRSVRARSTASRWHRATASSCSGRPPAGSTSSATPPCRSGPSSRGCDAAATTTGRVSSCLGLATRSGSPGEYRLLCHVTVDDESRAARYYVLSTGADEPRRLDRVEATPVHSNCVPSACDMITPAVFRGRLHWLRHPEPGSGGEMAVFDWAAFRRMTCPPTSDEHLTNLVVADGSLMASEFRELGVYLWVLGGGGGAGEEIRWERRHRVELPWQARMPTWLDVVMGGDVEGDVVLGTSNGVVVYNVRSGTARVVDVGPGAVQLTRRALRIRESFVRHGFFETRPHPGLPSFILYE